MVLCVVEWVDVVTVNGHKNHINSDLSTFSITVLMKEMSGLLKSENSSSLRRFLLLAIREFLMRREIYSMINCPDLFIIKKISETTRTNRLK